MGYRRAGGPAGPAEPGGEAGFILAEAVTALAVVALLVAGVYGMMLTGVKWWAAGEETVALQQNVRAALDLIRDEIRETGGLLASTTVSGREVTLDGQNLLLLDEDGVAVWYYLHESGALRRVKNGAYNTLAHGVTGLGFRYWLAGAAGEAPPDPGERARSALVAVRIEGRDSRGEGFALEGRAAVRARPGE